jgi:class 3 adenylate cyclase
VTSAVPQTRGFLFTDLRGYSAFTDRHGDAAARELIHRYRELVRAEVAAFGGAEIRTEGDSFYVVFSSVSQAVQCGLAIRDALAAASSDVQPIRVGIGIHAGEATDGDDGIVSSAVNVAARVCSAAQAGEVLVTDTVRSLTRTALPVAFEARGRRRLKGITEPVAVFAVTASDAAPAEPRSRWRRATVGAAVAAGIVVAAVIGAVAMTPRSPGLGAVPSTSTSIAPAPSSLSVETDEYPNAAEAALLDLLPASITASCDRADPDDVPIYADSSIAGIPARVQTTLVPLQIESGLTCLTKLVRVVYWQAASPAAVDAIFVQRTAKREVQQGSCEESSQAWETWSAGAYEGKLRCASTEGEPAAIEWTYGQTPIYAFATRRDGDADALLAWWREIGRLLSR